MQHRDAITIQKVIQEIDFATGVTRNMTQSDFDGDEIIKLAVCMAAINVGELVKNLSDELKQSNPGIRWRGATGLRDIAAHKYQTLSMDVVFVTIKQDFPELKQQLQALISKEQ